MTAAEQAQAQIQALAQRRIREQWGDLQIENIGLQARCEVLTHELAASQQRVLELEGAATAAPVADA